MKTGGRSEEGRRGVGSSLKGRNFEKIQEEADVSLIKSQEEGGRGAWEGEEGGREAAGGALLVLGGICVIGTQSVGYIH